MTNSNFNEESETDKLFKKLEEDSLFPEFNKNLNKGYARTVDFFDNLVGGDKRSFEEILENRSKIQNEFTLKRSQNLKDLKDSGKVDEIYRGISSAPFAFVNEVADFGVGANNYLRGKDYSRTEIFNLESMGLKDEGDEQSLYYTIPQALTQFLLPYGVLNKAAGGIKAAKTAKAVKAVKGIKSAKGLKAAQDAAKAAQKARKFGLSNRYVRNFAVGTVADSVAFNAYDDNLFNFINDQVPSLRNPVFNYLEAKTPEEESFAEAKLKQLLVGGILGETIGFGLEVAAPAIGKVAKKVTKPVVKKGVQVATDLVKERGELGKALGEDAQRLFNATKNLLNDIKSDPTRKANVLNKKMIDDAESLRGVTNIEPEMEKILKQKTELKSRPEPTKQPTGKGDFKPVDTERTAVLFGPRKQDQDFTRNSLNMMMKTEPENLDVLPNRKLLRIVEDLSLPEVLKKLDDDAATLSDPERLARMLKALKYQYKLTQELTDVVKPLEDAILANNAPAIDELYEYMGERIQPYFAMLIPNKKLSAGPARFLQARRLIDVELPDEGGLKGLVADSINEQKAPTTKGQKNKIKRPTVTQEAREFIKGYDEEQALPSVKLIVEALEQKDHLEMIKFLRAIGMAENNPKAIGELLRPMTKAQGFAKNANATLRVTNEVAINSVLTGFPTHILNVLTAGFNVGLGPYQLIQGAPLDTTAYLRAAKEYITMFTQLGNTLKMAGKAFKQDRNILDPSRVFYYDVADMYAIRMPGNSPTAQVTNAVGHTVRLPRRSMIAGDEIVKQTAFRSVLTGDIWEEGWRAGKRGAELNKFVKTEFERHIKILTEDSIDAFEGTAEQKAEALRKYIRAVDYAAQRTFTRELGTGYFKKATRPVAKVMQLPAFKLVNFFVGTPVNLAKSGIRLDPLTGIGSYFQDPKKIPGLPRLIKEYQEELASTDWATRTRAVGEARTGGQILAAFSLLALADEDDPNHPVVLNGPSYHKSSLNKSPRFQRKLPNSLGFLKYDENGDPVIGADGKPERWYFDLSRLDPFATIISTAGIIGTLYHHSDDLLLEDAGVAIAAISREFVRQRFFLEGISNIFEVMDNIPYKAPDWIAKQLKLRFSPIPAGLGGVINRNRTQTIVDDSIDLETGENKVYRGNFVRDKKIYPGDLSSQYIDKETGLVEDKFEVPLVQDFLTRMLITLNREILNSTPGFNSKLPAKTDVTTGRFIEYPQGFGPNYFTPIKSSERFNDPVHSFLEDIKFPIPQMPKVLDGGIELNNVQYNALERITSLVTDDNNNQLYDRLFELIQNKDIRTDFNRLKTDKTLSKRARMEILDRLHRPFNKRYQKFFKLGIMRFLQTKDGEFGMKKGMSEFYEAWNKKNNEIESEKAGFFDPLNVN